MHFISLAACTTLFVACSVAAARRAEAQHDLAGTTLDLNIFVAKERIVALQGALANIGPDGSKVEGAASGLVVASPSKANPDYFYTWTRDAALTIKVIVDEFMWGKRELQTVIENYVHAQAKLQTVSNPSGTLEPNGLGLAEPKFLVDGTRFNGAWGRPQRDGPALRAIALMQYSWWLVQQGQEKKASEIIWPIIANDLSYVGQYWNQSGFDLWEELNGSSFFTLLNQYRSLVEGAALAKTLGVKCTGCSEAPELLCFLQSFWNGEYIVTNINLEHGRSGKDANAILASIAVFDLKAQCDGFTFQPCNSKSLANFKIFVDSFREIYPINRGIPVGQGISIGRYPEDIYMGGNPWYLIVLGAAEFLYDAVAQWRYSKKIIIDEISIDFFRDIYPSAKIGIYDNRDSVFLEIISAVTEYADSFLIRIEKYIPTDGSLAEQYDKTTGEPVSAVDLTWSYAAFVTMAQRRSGQYPVSWRSRRASPPPDKCAGSSTPGLYAPATAAGAPNSTYSCTVTVSFDVNATTYFGENVYVVGNTSDLGAWDINNAQPLNPGKYTSERPLWYADVQLPGDVVIDFKYVRQENCNQPYIYEDINRTLTIPPCGDESVSTSDAWEGNVGQSGNC